MRGGDNEDGARDDDEGGDECGRELPGGQRAGASPGIGSVDGGVGESIKGHGGGARRKHGNHDPEKLMPGRKAGGGEHGSAESEWESEDGVLPFDHLEGDAKVAKDEHELCRFSSQTISSGPRSSRELAVLFIKETREINGARGPNRPLQNFALTGNFHN